MAYPSVQHQSWGRVRRPAHTVAPVRWSTDPLPPRDGLSWLPYGLGRSYGDVCENPDQGLLETTSMDRVLEFDPATGILECEAGFSLAEMIDRFLPRGWFPPVTPGTKFVTVGGAIANDVHGKNHHRAGTFGRHVLGLELLRSDGSRRWCSPAINPDWFAATVGGLGLTGLITRARLRLKPAAGPWIDMETVKFRSLPEFFRLAAESDRDFEYTVAWVDCVTGGKDLVRGHYMRGNPAKEGPPAPRRKKPRTFPFEAPGGLLNTLTVRAFNTLYFHRQRSERVASKVHIDPFFYPLDAVHLWNRMYGRKGFFQHQCVVPFEASSAPMEEIFRAILASRQGSFLAVLKVFGDLASPGLLSFPQPGVTLALDFPNRGARTLRLLAELDAIALRHGGRTYPAKDNHMTPAHFQSCYPRWKDMTPFLDPAFSSGFWRRVTA
jgi:FAD/FMN-containing dehydrogenase